MPTTPHLVSEYLTAAERALTKYSEFINTNGKKCTRGAKPGLSTFARHNREGIAKSTELIRQLVLEFSHLKDFPENLTNITQRLMFHVSKHGGDNVHSFINYLVDELVLLNEEFKTVCDSKSDVQLVKRTAVNDYISLHHYDMSEPFIPIGFNYERIKHYVIDKFGMPSVSQENPNIQVFTHPTHGVHQEEVIPDDNDATPVIGSVEFFFSQTLRDSKIDTQKIFDETPFSVETYFYKGELWKYSLDEIDILCSAICYGLLSYSIKRIKISGASQISVQSEADSRNAFGISRDTFRTKLLKLLGLFDLSSGGKQELRDGYKTYLLARNTFIQSFLHKDPMNVRLGARAHHLIASKILQVEEVLAQKLVTMDELESMYSCYFLPKDVNSLYSFRTQSIISRLVNLYAKKA